MSGHNVRISLLPYTTLVRPTILLLIIKVLGEGGFQRGVKQPILGFFRIQSASHPNSTVASRLSMLILADKATV